MKQLPVRVGNKNVHLRLARLVRLDISRVAVDAVDKATVAVARNNDHALVIALGVVDTSKASQSAIRGSGAVRLDLRVLLGYLADLVTNFEIHDVAIRV